MKIISNAFKLFLSLLLLFSLVGCGGLYPFKPVPEELLYFSWTCNSHSYTGQHLYGVSLVVHGSGDLTGTLGDITLSGGPGTSGPTEQCQNIATEAIDIANVQGCETRGAVVGTNMASFTAFCTGSRTKLISVMGKLLHHAQTFTLTTP